MADPKFYVTMAQYMKLEADGTYTAGIVMRHLSDKAQAQNTCDKFGKIIRNQMATDGLLPIYEVNTGKH